MYKEAKTDFLGQLKSIDMYRSKISVYPTIVNQYMCVEGLEEESKYQIISNNQVLVKTGSLTNNQEIDIRISTLWRNLTTSGRIRFGHGLICYICTHAELYDQAPTVRRTIRLTSFLHREG